MADCTVCIPRQGTKELYLIAESRAQPVQDDYSTWHRESAHLCGDTNEIHVTISWHDTKKAAYAARKKALKTGKWQRVYVGQV